MEVVLQLEIKFVQLFGKMKDKLNAIAGELKKASAKHKGHAEKIEKLIKPKLSKLHKKNRKKSKI